MAAIHSLKLPKATQVSELREQMPRRKRARRHFDSLSVLYAHAYAIESEAQARYLEFARRMDDSGNAELAALFGRLATLEAEHTFSLAMKSGDAEIPALAPNQYAWLDSGPPVPEARALAYNLMTPRIALEIALSAEERAKAFYDDICAKSRRAQVRRLAAQLAREEGAHAQWCRQALARVAQPFQPSDEQPGDPAIEQCL